MSEGLRRPDPPVITEEEQASQAITENIERVRGQIAYWMSISNYDHRPSMPDEIAIAFPHLLHPFQLRYARFKMAVAAILKPRTIFEIGVGWGISAKAFMAGCPTARFVGIDNGEMGIHPGMALRGTNALWDLSESDAAIIPHGTDLIHIDGGHGREQKARDVALAFKARPEWILVDDVHDVMVAAGTFDGIYRTAANGLKMAYFENSHTGSLLIYVGRKEPESR